MKTLCVIITVFVVFINPTYAEDKPKSTKPESSLVVIDGHLLRVTGDEVKVLWIHPKERPIRKQNLNVNWDLVP